MSGASPRRIIRFDDEWFASVGLAEFDADQRRDLRSLVEARLQTLIGEGLVARCTPDQREELFAISDADDGERLEEWLQTTLPDFRDFMRQLFAEVSEEIRAAAEDFLRAR